MLTEYPFSDEAGMTQEDRSHSEITGEESTLTWLQQATPLLLSKFPFLVELSEQKVRRSAYALKKAEEKLRLCEKCEEKAGICKEDILNDGFRVPYIEPSDLKQTYFNFAWKRCEYGRKELRKIEVCRLRDRADFPARHKHFFMGKYDWPGKASAIQYIKDYEDFSKKGEGLLFMGSVGTGKTAILVATAKGIIGRYLTKTLFVSSVDYLQKLRESFAREYHSDAEDIRAKYSHIPLLILDDLGAEKITDWVREELYKLIDYRYREMMPCLTSTNCTLEELEENIGERSFSRLIEMCRVVALEGEDRRKAGISLT